MDGKVNINLAGNFVANPLASTPQTQLGVEGRPEGHISFLGASPAEINPRHLLTLDQQDVNGNPSWENPTNAAPYNRGDYWPVWIQPNPTSTSDPPTPPVYVDPIYLRLLLSGLPAMTGGTRMPATAANVNVPGRWSHPNSGSSNFLLDRPGQRLSDDDASMPTAFNANIPTETVGTAPIVRGTVSSSLGPVGWQAGRRYPPFTKRAAALSLPPLATAPAAGSASYEVGGVFPKFVNHVHSHFRDGRSYWPGYDATAIGFPPPYNPAMAPALTTAGLNTGEFDVGTPPTSGSMNISAPTFPFDLTTFGIAGTTGFAGPAPANFWNTSPGTIAYNHANFPSFLQSMQILMTTDDANEVNPYLTSSSYNSPFTDAQIEQMLRFPDIDATSLDDRVVRLLNFNVGAEKSQIVGTPYQYNAVMAVRERMRRMWTAQSWDLIHFSNPPAFGDPANIPRPGAYAPAATQLASRNGPMPNDAAVYAAAPTPNYGVLPTALGSFQHNGKLWTPPNPADPNAPLGYAFFTDTITAGTPPTTTRTAANTVIGAELSGRYPLEVLRGRRYDLNRPLTSFESQPRLADAERTAMAQQIYVLLYISAGLNMRPLPANVQEAREAFAQARTLAQLAVNIVDYIDPDNVMTEMRFHPFLQCPSMTVTPGGTSTTTAATQWDALENDATTAATFTFDNTVIPPLELPDVQREEFTVMGFEMPDLVISEGVSVTVDDQNAAGTNEITFVWAELFNPWPNETDLDSGAAGVTAPTPRGRLFDQTPATPITPGGRTLAQSRFVLGVRQNNALAGNKAPEAPGTLGDFHGNTQRYVHFAGPNTSPGMNGVNTPDGNFTAPRDAGSNGPDIRGGQRLLVEPNLFAATMGGTADPGVLIQDWTPASGPNRFTCSAPILDTDAEDLNGTYDLRIVRPAVNPGDDNDANVVVSLYRLRNPYRDWHPVTNPYIAIDTLELRGNAANQTLAEGAYDLTKGTPPAIGERRSMERKQPWHGSNRPWTPYKGATTNPMATLFDGASTPPRFLEGKFLGFPYLTADATPAGVVNPTMTTQQWGNQLIANGFEKTNPAVATRGHTLHGTGETTATPYATNHTDTQNTQDAGLPANQSRYVSFPFLNRQLASPMELLSVRLYGSYPWAVPGSTTAGQDREWRLRFTDDFEFRQATADNQVGPNYPPLPGGGFNRVYRSREVPWYLNDRTLHPIDGNPASGFTGYDPTPTAAAAQASGNRLAPFPNLFRFFEMVETHSRVNGAGGWGTLAASIASPTGADLREPRVAGKINPNVITDEETFKAWLDSEEAMPFWVVNDLSVKVGLGMAPAAALSAGDDRYRPINYPADISSSYSVPSVGMNFDPGAVRALAWNGNISELLQSLVADDPASNNSFVNSSAPAGGNQFIDFGGITTMMSPPSAPLAFYPGGDLTTSGYKRLIHNQFPGIVNGYYGYNASATAAQSLQGLYPGWDRDMQVGSEFFRTFVFSRNGRDALWGTADDKAFTGFGSAYLSDTLLRQRNYAHLDFPNDARYGSTASPSIYGSQVTTPAGTNGGAPGEYITRLGGQWTPRLFDPVPLPYTLDNNPTSTATIARQNTVTIARRADVAPIPGTTPPEAPHGSEYWMLEWRRNEILSKIASNTTSRSNVFGVWITVGYFRVEPGTENLLVPLLHEEVGSTTGTQRRHRMFAIVDRTQAKEFTELMTTNPPKLEDNAMVRHHSFIE
jgi:hypothetical protein